jgi:hypothetical protein
MDVMARYRRGHELQRESQKARLAREALAAQGPRPRQYQLWLSWLGKQLVEWGRQLQQLAQMPQYSR